MQRLFVSLVIVSAALVGALAFVTSRVEAGGGGYGGCFDKPREAAGQPITIQNNCFAPTVLYIETGASVTWTNQDEVPHNVTFLKGNVAGGDASVMRNENVSHTFDAAGVYAYYCSIHPSMLGVVAVGEPAGFVLVQPPQSTAPPEQALATLPSTSRSSLTLPTAGLILGVGIVSAGSGYFLRRRS